ncbi:MAG TPA: urea carboxylase [Polyangiales bacterium]
MFDKVLIANRGEIACRVVRTLARMGVRSVAVYSEADAHALHVRRADEAVCIGAAPVAESYLRVDHILDAARKTGAQAIHPGYGFLSENAQFASACEEAGIRFIGPTADQIRRFGLKHAARAVAIEAKVPLLPGTGLVDSLQQAREEAVRVGYPIMLKSTAGGGGIGLRVCRDPEALGEAYEAVRRLSKSHFDGGGVFLEKYLDAARHIEVQIFGDGRGKVLALGERDCSAQRRNQKVIEETPAPGLSERVRAELFDAALRLARKVGYASAGTVEFVYDDKTQEFYFLEVNTRLQVEHGVTEEVTGIDLVEWMVKQAAGELTLPDEAPRSRGAAIEVRLYAEDPNKNFQPSTGTLTHVAFPDGVRCDSWVESGTEVTSYYDPLLAKLIVSARDRHAAVRALAAALRETRLDGIEGNLGYLRQVVDDEAFVRGGITTRYLQTVSYQPRTIEVLDGGTQTTVQDYPGRSRYWAVGVPPSGPMDDYAARLANRLVGNPSGAAVLEMTLSGPKLLFNTDALIALGGASMSATLDGRPVPLWQPLRAAAGSMLELGMVQGNGMRCYLAVSGAFDVPAYLGSAATFMLGRFGGHGGRALRASDVLRIGPEEKSDTRHVPLPEALRPSYPEVWEIGVLYGPHGAPDFFTQPDIDTFFATTWEVHYNSDRTGVRLIGPRPKWARKDGGDAGLHPSNIHDNAYAIGTVDYTGDMPVILGPDGPSLGGFVCPATIVKAERWKMGQLKAGAKLRFVRMDEAQAEALLDQREAEIRTLLPQRAVNHARSAAPRLVSTDHAVLDQLAQDSRRPRVVYRRAGDDYLLVEYGPLELDLALRFRVHTLMTALQAQRISGILDLTPGIRSLQVHYAPELLSTRRLLDRLTELERDLPSIDEMEVPTRIVHLPLSWEDPATLLAIDKYMRVVRKDAPWCPSNIEFIRRINGLSSVDEVRKIVFDASYLVLGLGDVYLGAPVATPTDPRHRLVTTKYNPARTWTPENAVGIGGAYMCIYGMEGPGGYQFVGRTLQVWNTYRTTREFSAGKPWLLRFFDQIRFYPVSADELLLMRSEFPHGKLRLKIEEQTFRFREYREFLREHAESIGAFKHKQSEAFVQERERWAAAGQDVVTASAVESSERALGASELPAGTVAVTSPVAGSLWKLLVEPGQHVLAGTTVAIVEAMKTEISVASRVTGRVRELRVEPGASVSPAQTLIVLEPD